MEEPKWKRMMFKGNKVYARTDALGNLLIREGLVTIKYQLSQEQEYRAKAEAVRHIDEELLKKKHPRKPDHNKPSAESASLSPLTALPEDSIIVYTDGACTGNPGPAGIGIILTYRGQRKELSRFIGSGTNNIAELTAILLALKEIKNSAIPVFLYTDSAYACGVLLMGWKPKKNQDLIQKIKAEMARFASLTIIKVKGHAGNEENERADQLARQAISDHFSSSKSKDI
ncbi:MAG TPA: ribonuclease H [Thermodesulfobacteriota bacterium]|nr:ribonuclease H [Thermodesulfobacteriota bacterium]HNU70690.1 ribonuclease H [Thermodesulfobacteriota bacterium]